LDGKPLEPLRMQGMTLQDYAKGGAWGTAQSGFFGSSSGNASAATRTATAPIWRKTRAQRVDAKIESLKTVYREATEGSNALLKSESRQRDENIKKYFPGKDVPLKNFNKQDEYLAIA